MVEEPTEMISSILESIVMAKKKECYRHTEEKDEVDV